MGVFVTVKSTDQDLTTTSELKAMQFGATATSTAQDAWLSDRIRRASAWAETYVGQPLTVQTYEELVPGYGRRRLMLSRTPIRAVLGVFDATDTGVASELTTQLRIEDRDAGFVSQDQGFWWTATQTPRVGAPAYGGDAVPLDFSPAPGQEYRPFLVRYVAGYTYVGVDSAASPNWATGGMPGATTDTGRTLPYDIEEAVAIKAQAFYNGGDEVQAETLGDLTVNYRSLGVDANGRLITRSEDLLSKYRRVA